MIIHFSTKLIRLLAIVLQKNLMCSNPDRKYFSAGICENLCPILKVINHRYHQFMLDNISFGISNAT